MTLAAELGTVVGVRVCLSPAVGAQTIPPKSYVLGTTMFRKPKTANLKGIVGKDYKSYSVRVLVPIGDDKLVFLFPVELLQALPHPQH
jgi:hypothetical protein